MKGREGILRKKEEGEEKWTEARNWEIREVQKERRTEGKGGRRKEGRGGKHKGREENEEGERHEKRTRKLHEERRGKGRQKRRKGRLCCLTKFWIHHWYSHTILTDTTAHITHSTHKEKREEGKEGKRRKVADKGVDMRKRREGENGRKGVEDVVDFAP